MTAATVDRRRAGRQTHPASMMTIGSYRRHLLGEMVMQGTTQSLRVERGFSCIRDVQGGAVLCHLIVQHSRRQRSDVRVRQTGTAAIAVAGSKHQPEEVV